MSYLNERVILVTGASGQVGFELVRSFQGLGRVVAPGRDTLDLASGRQIEELIREVRPSLIVNPAAYTAVDHAETEIDLANSINAVAPGILASEARRLRIPLIHYSTDYVFDGTGDGAYSEGDRVGPLNVYGKSKLDGELAIAELGRAISSSVPVGSMAPTAEISCKRCCASQHSTRNCELWMTRWERPHGRALLQN